MTEALVSLGLSNLLLSTAMGLLAWTVHRRERFPGLAHVLWVLTLVAAVTPPLLVWSLPVLPGQIVADGRGLLTTAAAAAPDPAGAARLAAGLPAILLTTWATGSLIVFVASAQRIVRFGLLLRRSCHTAPAGVQRMAAEVAYELGLRTVPSIHVSAARLAPMTWWSGGRVRVVLPRALGAAVDDAQLRWILAHELAHIKRHDHFVRWLEWLASVAFWWNPVVWWARRDLRRDEEDACDALVLERLQGQPRAYARTLLTVVEVLSAGGAPALATGLDAARSLEHRFTRIVSPGRVQRTPPALAAGSVAAAVLLLSVGVGVGEAAPPAKPSAVFSVPAGIASARSTAGSAAHGPGPARLPVRAHLVRTLAGTAEADTIRGTAANDTIKGYGGGDSIRGGGGADTLDGGRGRDRIGGGPGPDRINGGAGADVIQGGRGHDTVWAGPGDDIVRVWADGAPDVVDCGSGRDRAVVDRSDTATHCEVVIIRDPS